MSQLDPNAEIRTLVRQNQRLPLPNLVALLVDDQRARWYRGERVDAEVYLESCAAVPGDRTTALDLIYSEFLIREELGEAPTLEEYQARFPDWAEALARQIELHRAVGFEADLPSHSITHLDKRSWPQVEGYTIQSELGRGAAAVIYLARQLSLNRDVALKVLRRSSQLGSSAPARFLREAKVVARLRHPNIIQIYEVGETQQQPYLALEYAAGGTLAQMLRNGPLAPVQAARLVQALAKAMQHAHDAGVIHRDLKPGNVLMADEDTPKISDFGLARLLEGSKQTRSGTILGTPPYMAPEQAAGRPASHEADIYALGAILYEMVTGQAPFKGANAWETLKLVQHQPPVPPSQLHDQVPAELERICLKCLEKDPADRYTQASDLADDLQHFLDRLQHYLRRESRRNRGPGWLRRHQRVILMGLLPAALMAAMGVGFTAVWLMARQPTSPTASQLVADGRHQPQPQPPSPAPPQPGEPRGPAEHRPGDHRSQPQPPGQQWAPGPAGPPGAPGTPGGPGPGPPHFQRDQRAPWIDHLDWGDAFLAAGRLDAAREQYQMALRHVRVPGGGPNLHPVILNKLGDVAVAEANLDAARDFYQQAHAAWERSNDPACASVCFKLGQLERRAGKEQQAQAWFQECRQRVDEGSPLQRILTNEIDRTRR
jgi:serine/threonine protein kinase